MTPLMAPTSNFRQTERNTQFGKWRRRNCYEHWFLGTLAVLSLWLLPQLSDAVQVPQLVPHVSFGLILNPESALLNDPQVRYDEIGGHQCLTITLFGATQAGTASPVLDDAKRCSPNFDIVHELQGSVAIRTASASVMG